MELRKCKEPLRHTDDTERVIGEIQAFLAV